MSKIVTVKPSKCLKLAVSSKTYFFFFNSSKTEHNRILFSLFFLPSAISKHSLGTKITLYIQKCPQGAKILLCRRYVTK
jgi:hypothetical protein